LFHVRLGCDGLGLDLLSAFCENLMIDSASVPAPLAKITAATVVPLFCIMKTQELYGKIMKLRIDERIFTISRAGTLRYFSRTILAHFHIRQNVIIAISDSAQRLIATHSFAIILHFIYDNTTISVYEGFFRSLLRFTPICAIYFFSISCS
jgi:hypothetical protein